MTAGAEDVFDSLGLTEYEETALQELISLGQASAPNLSEASGIPKARIYGVLESLSDRGFIKVIPGRPKLYQSKSPAEILERAVENQRQEFEQFRSELDASREAFLEEYGPRFERASEDISPASELFHVVDVGEPSERETRRIYDTADRELLIMSKSMEYFDSVRHAFEDAIASGVDVSILLMDPDRLSNENRKIQSTIVDELSEKYPDVGLKFSPERLPWRGTVADPSLNYDSGTAILLVQEDDVPNHMRQAAITENGSFVAGLKRYFNLVWEHEAFELP